MASFANSAGPRPKAQRESQIQWETRVVTMPRQTTRQEAKAMLTEFAEYGRWELARVRVYRDGRRWALLRRKAMKVERSDDI